MADRTGLEPVISPVTGECDNRYTTGPYLAGALRFELRTSVLETDILPLLLNPYEIDRSLPITVYLPCLWEVTYSLIFFSSLPCLSLVRRL